MYALTVCQKIFILPLEQKRLDMEEHMCQVHCIESVGQNVLSDMMYNLKKHTITNLLTRSGLKEKMICSDCNVEVRNEKTVVNQD
jgi:hypothetical protein